MAKEQNDDAIDYAKLVGLETADKPAEEKAPDPEPKTQAEKTEPDPEKKPEPKEPEEEPPSKALTKMQQRQTTLERQQADQAKRMEDRQERLEKALAKQAKALGIEEETPQPEAVKSDASLEQYNELQRKLALQEREIEFFKITRKHPDADPEVMLTEAISEACELHGVDPDAPLPDGFDKSAIDRVAGNLFRKKVEALGKKKPALPVKEEPLRPLPEKTRNGSKVSAAPASHIPDASRAPKREESVKEEYLRLTGQLED